MRVFIFAIGGTGTRVLTSLLMQFAAGVRPKDQNGQPIKNLTVVPIIVDPHVQNASLLKTVDLLDKYRTLRKKIHGSEIDAEGFFSVHIATLKETASHDRNDIGDHFFFTMRNVSDNNFSDFINLNDMELSNRMLMEMLFSEDELSTQMHEGFYGSPNIGTVALNEFKKSKDFQAFQSAFSRENGDRIFFIGSIFGGTGASGLPLFISSIRDLTHGDNTDAGRTQCAEAPIGALIVMPYFAIEQKEDSPIDENQFIIKTKSALRYYKDNLNPYVNCTYYISDSDRTKTVENDPGNVANQKGNKAHIVEYIGATAVCDFISKDDDDLLVQEDFNGRTVAQVPMYFQYSLKEATSTVSFASLPSSTNELTMLPMMKFYLLKDYMLNTLESKLREPFASNYTPKIEKSILSREIVSFFSEFDKWVNEMQDQGPTAHNLTYYNPGSSKNFTNVFNTVNPQKRMLGHKSLEVGDIDRALNKEAQVPNAKNSQEARWYMIADKALENAIICNLDIQGFK